MVMIIGIKIVVMYGKYNVTYKSRNMKIIDELNRIGMREMNCNNKWECVENSRVGVNKRLRMWSRCWMWNIKEICYMISYKS